MSKVRFWQPSDLPDLERMMAQLNWGIMPPGDRAAAGLERVAAMAVHSLRSTLSSPGATAVVAEEGGRPVGFLLACIQQDDRSGEWLGYLADIYLDPAHRGKGLAKQMDQLANEHLRRLGLRKAYAWIHTHNPQGQAAAGRHGLHLWGVVLSKELQAGPG